LLAVADVAGGEWPARARAAAGYLNKHAAEESETKGVELLCHIREAFGDVDRLESKALVESLLGRDESPWRDMRGKPLDERGLASRLKPYGIKSKVIRLGDRTPRGYAAEDFHDAWSRYLPLWDPLGNKRNSRNTFDNKNNSVADVADVSGGMAEADEYEERAAILEFDAGLSRTEAEAQAAEEIDLTLPKWLDRRPRARA
jgi:hypothetical protein